VILYSKKMFFRSSTLLLPVSPAKIIIVIRTGDKLIRSDAMAIIRMSEPNVICEFSFLWKNFLLWRSQVGIGQRNF